MKALSKRILRAPLSSPNSAAYTWINPARLLLAHCRPTPTSISALTLHRVAPEASLGPVSSRRLQFSSRYSNLHSPSTPLSLRHTSRGSLGVARDLHIGKQYRERKRLESSTSSVLYLVPLVALGAIIFYNAVDYTVSDLSESNIETETKTEPIRKGVADEFDFAEMSVLPGRLGNLTPEQEEKLSELWRLVLQVCGVDDEGGGESALAESPTPIQARAPTAGSEKPKKKRLGIFKKKDKKEKEDASSEKVSAPLDGVKDDDPDDKYGQNKVFRETLANSSPESIRETLWKMVKMDHPDQLVLRFLRARKWDVQKALVMLVSTMKWRQDVKVDDDIMVNGEEQFLSQEQDSDETKKRFANDFLEQLRMGKSFCHGADKEGRPISVVRVRLHKAGEQSQESLERYTIFLIETARLLLTPPVETGAVVFDMTGFSMANMDYTPVKFMIQCFEANYPESLGVVLVHKAPWIFQGIWKIIRGWLDPVVASKVNFTNNVKEMSEFLVVNKIPKEMDGEDPWEFEYVEPVIGENAKLKDTVTRDKLFEVRDALYEEYEQRTYAWIREKDSAKKAAIMNERNEIAKKLREGYWILDPYIRARSLYDRVGVLKPDGTADYYAWNKPSSANGLPTTTSTPAVVETSADDID